MNSRTRAQIKRASGQARRALKKLDRSTRRDIKKLYRQARADIERQIQAAESLDGIVKIESLARLRQQLNIRLAELDLSRDALLGQQLRAAADLGVNPFMAVSAGLTALADEAVRQTVNFIAADGLQLTDRIWRINQHAREIMANQVEQAIIRGDSAARAAREFTTQGLTIPADLQRKLGKAQAHKIAAATGAELMKQGSPYQNALRLFRTEINRAHGEAYQAAAFDSPDVIGTQFLLSPAHPEADICDMHAKVNRYGLGPGVYPKGKNPWPAHPNTLSFTVVVFAEEVTAEHRAGKENRIDWLKKQSPATQYGVLGASKKVAALDRGLLKENAINTPWKKLKVYYKKKGIDPSGWTVATAKPTPALVAPFPDAKIPPFTPARTPGQASRWAMDNNLADYADYSGANITAANAWNESVHYHINRFPELRPGLKVIGTMQARNRYAYDQTVQSYLQRLREMNSQGVSEARLLATAKRRVKRRKVNGGIYAESTYRGTVNGVTVNSKWAGNPAKFTQSLQGDVNAGFHPVGTDNIKAVIDHELGHQLDGLLGLRQRDDIRKLYKEWGYNNNEGNGLSRYALKNIAEFIAEGWAEYLNNPTPRPMAANIGRIINEQYRRQYHD